MESFGLTFQRWVLVAVFPLMAVVFWSGSSDPVNVTKMTVAAIAALLVVVSTLIRIALLRRVSVSAPLGVSVLVLAFGLVAATVASDVPGASVAGAFGRSDGLLLYLSCLVLFFVASSAFSVDTARISLLALLGAGAFACAYGLLQRAGADPVHWVDIGLSPVIGTFGNPDFESGYLGVVVPAAAWGALTTTWSRAWRVMAGALLLLAGATAVLTHAIQGPVAAAAGLVVVAVAVLLDRGERWARAGVRALLGVFALVAVAGAAGLATESGPFGWLGRRGSFAARRWYWSAALAMWRRHPWTGVGLDRYGAYYRAVRASAGAPVNDYSDAAHSVPLHLLATGGLLVFLPYVALALLVAWLLIRGVRRHEGERRLLLAGVGGAWVAFQVQSLVSIDQPGIAVTGWVLAGVVAAVAGRPRLKTWPLKRQPAAPLPVKGRRRPSVASPTVEWSGAAYAVAALTIVVGLLAFWQVIKPLRASHASRSSIVALSAGLGNPAFEALNTATRLAPYEQSYWLQRGRFLQQVRQPELAITSYRDGLRADPRSYDLALALDNIAHTQQRNDLESAAERVLQTVDPSGSWQQAISK